MRTARNAGQLESPAEDILSMSATGNTPINDERLHDRLRIAHSIGDILAHASSPFAMPAKAIPRLASIRSAMARRATGTLIANMLLRRQRNGFGEFKRRQWLHTFQKRNRFGPRASRIAAFVYTRAIRKKLRVTQRACPGEIDLVKHRACDIGPAELSEKHDKTDKQAELHFIF